MTSRSCGSRAVQGLGSWRGLVHLTCSPAQDVESVLWVKHGAAGLQEGPGFGFCAQVTGGVHLTCSLSQIQARRCSHRLHVRSPHACCALRM